MIKVEREEMRKTTIDSLGEFEGKEITRAS